jgi:hypothetical protein
MPLFFLLKKARRSHRTQILVNLHLKKIPGPSKHVGRIFIYCGNKLNIKKGSRILWTSDIMYKKYNLLLEKAQVFYFDLFI